MRKKCVPVAVSVVRLVADVDSGLSRLHFVSFGLIFLYSHDRLGKGSSGESIDGDKHDNSPIKKDNFHSNTTSASIFSSTAAAIRSATANAATGSTPCVTTSVAKEATSTIITKAGITFSNSLN
jgi:hypothetical protein